MLRKILLQFVGALLLTPGLALSASAAPVQVVSNGGFESGDFSGWNITNVGPSGGTFEQIVAAYDTDGDLSDSLAARFRVGGTIGILGSQPYRGILLSQSITLLSDTNLEFSLAVASDNTAFNGVNYQGGLFELLFNGTVLDSFDAAFILGGAIERHILSSSQIGVTAGFHSVGVRITRPGAIFTSTTPAQYVDDFSVLSSNNSSAVVPIPAALPLLAGGLGILSLFGWRRK